MNSAAIGLLLVLSVQSQQPTPRPRKGESQQPQNQSTAAQQQPDANPRGTDALPVVVKVQPSTKTDEETAQEKQDSEDRASDQRWTKGAVVVTSLIGFLQLIVFGYQALKLKQTIVKMDEIATAQGLDMKNYIVQTTSSAKSMESIAQSLAANATQLEAAMETNREIAQTAAKNVQFAYMPHVSVTPKYFHCTGTPEQRPRWYLLTAAIVNTCGLHVRLLSATAACVIDGTERGTGEIRAQTIAPGRDVEILVTLQLTSDEIDGFESDGITIVQRITVWLNHQLDGPFSQTFSQAVLCAPGRNPVLLTTTDYLGEP